MIFIFTIKKYKLRRFECLNFKQCWALRVNIMYANDLRMMKTLMKMYIMLGTCVMRQYHNSRDVITHTKRKGKELKLPKLYIYIYILLKPPRLLLMPPRS